MPLDEEQERAREMLYSEQMSDLLCFSNMEEDFPYALCLGFTAFKDGKIGLKVCAEEGIHRAALRA